MGLKERLERAAAARADIVIEATLKTPARRKDSDRDLCALQARYFRAFAETAANVEQYRALHREFQASPDISLDAYCDYHGIPY